MFNKLYTGTKYLESQAVFANLDYQVNDKVMLTLWY